MTSTSLAWPPTIASSSVSSRNTTDSKSSLGEFTPRRQQLVEQPRLQLQMILQLLLLGENNDKKGERSGPKVQSSNNRTQQSWSPRCYWTPASAHRISITITMTSSSTRIANTCCTRHASDSRRRPTTMDRQRRLYSLTRRDTATVFYLSAHVRVRESIAASRPVAQQRSDNSASFVVRAGPLLLLIEFAEQLLHRRRRMQQQHRTWTQADRLRQTRRNPEWGCLRRNRQKVSRLGGHAVLPPSSAPPLLFLFPLQLRLLNSVTWWKEAIKSNGADRHSFFCCYRQPGISGRQADRFTSMQQEQQHWNATAPM